MIQAELPPSHLDLLRIARRVRATAVAADDDALHGELCDLRNALTNHLHAENHHLHGATGPIGRITLEGQQRLLRLIDDLLLGPRTGAECSCVVRAAEVEIALRRQAHLEALAFGVWGRNAGWAATPAVRETAR